MKSNLNFKVPKKKKKKTLNFYIFMEFRIESKISFFYVLSQIVGEIILNAYTIAWMLLFFTESKLMRGESPMGNDVI